MPQTTPQRPPPWHAPAALALSVGLSIGAGLVGRLLGGDLPNAWYDQLRKPAFNPPPWLFAPVWTLLYISMGVAAWWVWRRRGLRGGALALALFAAQLILNAAWTGLFFGLRMPGLAFVEIVVLWAAVAATAWAFFRAARPAGLLMLPYLAWVTFAAVLNLALWRLNA